MINQDKIANLLELAKKKGASDAEVSAYEGMDQSVSVRFGKIEKAASSKSVSLNLRLFLGGRVASGSTSDVSSETLEQLVDKTYQTLTLMAEDTAVGLPSFEDYAKHKKDLELFDEGASSYALEDQIEVACRMECAAFAYDKRIKNLEACESSVSSGHIFYGSTRGFLDEFKITAFERGIAIIAKSDSGMQSANRISSARLLLMLDTPEDIGKEAAKRAVRQLDGRKVITKEVPVVFDPQVAKGFIGIVAKATSGSSIYKEASLFCGKLETVMAPPIVTIVDDATIPRFLGSRPFDAEGVSSRVTVVVGKGVLRSYLLDSYTARKLNLATTGNARGGAPSNFFLKKGNHSPQEIIASVKDGLYVTETAGFGVNLLNGDYSKGASGIWIHNGELTYPVEEITIASNWQDMLMNIEMVGSDLEFRSKVSSPTIKISRMTVAGN